MKFTIYLALLINLTFASNINTAQNALLQINKNAATSQSKINKFDAQSKKYLLKYRGLIAKLNALQSYNKQLKSMILSQEKLLSSLDEQILSIEETKQVIFPLETRMVEAFNEFVAKDIPFLQAERQKRAYGLKVLLEQNDISLSEKYRRIIEAYKIEYDFSNSIEAYRDNITLSGENIKVDFLRVGRVALYYLTLDGLDGGYYDKNEKRFKPLGKKYLKKISKAIKIAKKYSAPNVLILPVNNLRTK